MLTEAPNRHIEAFSGKEGIRIVKAVPFVELLGRDLKLDHTPPLSNASVDVLSMATTDGRRMFAVVFQGDEGTLTRRSLHRVLELASPNPEGVIQATLGDLPAAGAQKREASSDDIAKIVHLGRQNQEGIHSRAFPQHWFDLAPHVPIIYEVLKHAEERDYRKYSQKFLGRFITRDSAYLRLCMEILQGNPGLDKVFSSVPELNYQGRILSLARQTEKIVRMSDRKAHQRLQLSPQVRRELMRKFAEGIMDLLDENAEAVIDAYAVNRHMHPIFDQGGTKHFLQGIDSYEKVSQQGTTVTSEYYYRGKNSALLKFAAELEQHDGILGLKLLPHENQYVVPTLMWSDEVGELKLFLGSVEDESLPQDYLSYLQQVADESSFTFDPKRFDTLVGYMGLIPFSPLRKDWKPYMNLRGEESDQRLPGFRQVAEAQVLLRALFARDQVLQEPIFTNAQKLVNLNGSFE